MFCPAEIMLPFNVCNKYSSQLVCVLILFSALNMPFHLSSVDEHFPLNSGTTAVGESFKGKIQNSVEACM